MYANRLQAYEQENREVVSGPELEAEVLTSTARQLAEIRGDWDAEDRDDRLFAALKRNQRLWTFFQGELTNPEHPMPANVRQNLLNLSLFVDKRTFELMAEPAPEKLTILIDINKNIAAGLRENSAAA
ncbi:MAG: flagellar biosynthesis regulator FlaF [Desulfococcaceae bacterium]